MILEGRDQGKHTKQEETCSRKFNQFSSLTVELHTLTSINFKPREQYRSHCQPVRKHNEAEKKEIWKSATINYHPVVLLLHLLVSHWMWVLLVSSKIRVLRVLVCFFHCRCCCHELCRSLINLEVIRVNSLVWSANGIVKRSRNNFGSPLLLTSD